MLSALIGLLAGLFALLAGLFATVLGLSIGAAAIVAALLPILLLLLIPLLPLLLILWILRCCGLFRSRKALIVVVLLAVLLALGGGGYGWRHGVQAVRSWVDDNRDIMEACTGHPGASLTLDSDEDGWHLVCHAGGERTKPSNNGTPI
jgi:hypothetical protein